MYIKNGQKETEQRRNIIYHNGRSYADRFLYNCKGSGIFAKN